MKKKVLFIPLLALGFLTSCNNSTPTKHHFDVVCTNCTANSESSLSLDVNENEYATFNLLPNENYLLPVDIKVTSGNAVLTKNIDYIYSLGEDRLTGKVIIKSTDATNIHIEADEQGYLYIGNNKISKSGDYSKYDLQIQGDDEAGFIVYDYKTNTLTLSNARIAAEKVNLKEYSFPFESEQIETFASLIGWTGGGTLNIKANGLNYFIGSDEIDNDVGIVCPFEEGKINVMGPGSISFYEFDKGVILNPRGRTSLENLYFESFDLGEFGISSRELDITGCDIQLSSGFDISQSVGIYANDCLMLNSYVLSNNFYLGTKIAQFTLIDSFFEVNGTNTGIYANWLKTFGHVKNNKYTTKISATGYAFGITTVDAMELSNTEIEAVSTSDMTGHALITVDSEIIAYNCDIKAYSNVGQAIHGYYIELTNCNVEAICDEGIGILTSIRGAQPTSREYEPILVLNNCNVHAKASDVAIYGFGHFEETNCNNVPKYLEEMLSEELQLWMWALVDNSVEKLEYEGHFDPQTGAPFFVPTNALTEVNIIAAN